MAQATFSQTVGLQHEKVRNKLELLYQKDNTLWSMIKDKTDELEVSGRATRIPMELLAGGKFTQAGVDGSDLGLGSGITTDAGTLVPVYFAHAMQWSKQTEITTNSKEKAIEDFVTLQLKRGMEQFNTNVEAAIQGDGSNTLDTVVSTATNQLTVNNANQFQDGQDIQVWSALGGTNRGTATILSVDSNNKQLNLTGAIPGGTVAGDLLLIAGASGTANSGIFGIKYFQLSSNTGSVLGLNRSSYPGKLSTPHIAANSLPLTPAMARRTIAQIQIALGVTAPDDLELIYHMNLDQVAAWENLGIGVAQVQQQAVQGSNSIDMLKKAPPKTFAGRPLVASVHAAPGRIDGICLKNWGRVVNQPIAFYEVGGQTLFPVYGGSGGIATSTLSYLWMGANLFNANVRAGVYVDGLPIPTGY